MWFEACSSNPCWGLEDGVGRWSLYGSICQQCTVVLRLSLSLLPSSPPHPTFFSLRRHLSFTTSHLSPSFEFSLFFPSSLFLLSLSLSPSIFQIPPSVSVNQSPPLLLFLHPLLLIFPQCQLPSPHSPPMATCHSVNLFFLTLNLCLHHFSPSCISPSFF